MTKDLKPLPLISEELGIPHWKIRNWIRFGLHGKRLKPVRMGARLYLTAKTIKDYVRKHMPSGVARG